MTSQKDNACIALRNPIGEIDLNEVLIKQKKKREKRKRK